MSNVPDYVRKAVMEGGGDPQKLQLELLLALVDVIEQQTAVQERLADTFADLAKQE